MSTRWDWAALWVCRFCSTESPTWEEFNAHSLGEETNWRQWCLMRSSRFVCVEWQIIGLKLRAIWCSSLQMVATPLKGRQIFHSDPEDPVSTEPSNFCPVGWIRSWLLSPKLFSCLLFLLQAFLMYSSDPPVPFLQITNVVIHLKKLLPKMTNYHEGTALHGLFPKFITVASSTRLSIYSENSCCGLTFKSRC